ncbi:hypothetical protein [Lactiplantibacillus mudanjiangensis]|uniref:Uncharacterized protein n=1 Tax=Lactiplantibacillus mudanjiangensis TaxID=1296538 RepID=A0A660DXX1_9LACO|nr:hypothetical protein [Lactiplantibacillus mudanjiangensis]VDG26359.1 hypothetical protein [Lactobacillus brevis] [Lactiplantibacillus mudanjiangensis]VDG27885.1 hypothetical protein [Lactobacillus brevis] [Lactiplantibacillus mudanjiangensis]
MKNDEVLKSYEVWYWGYDKDNRGQTQMLRRDVLVSESMLKRFLSPIEYSYYEFVVGDGERWIVADALIMQLVEKTGE